MKTMVEMEKMISRVRPDKYKAVCKKHGIEDTVMRYNSNENTQECDA